MQAYSAYIIGPDGHVTQRIDLLCAEDADAHQRARELADGRTVELWQRDRFIASFVPVHSVNSAGVVHAEHH